MAHFIKDGTELAPEKQVWRSQPGIPPERQLRTEDWNEFRQALLDVQSFLRGDVIVPLRLSSSPDGSVAGTRGQIAIDTTTGITWSNRDGGTRWDPMFIPPERGWMEHFDRLLRSRLTVTTAGTGSATDSGVSAGRLGVVQLGVAATNDVVMIRSTTADHAFGQGVSSMRWASVITAALSNGTDDMTARLGWGDSTTTADNVDGIYMEYSRATNGDNNWRLVTASNSVYTRVDTGVIPTIGVYQSFELLVNAAGTSVTAYIDGAAVATATTNIPTAIGRSSSLLFTAIKTAGSNARAVQVDWIRDYYLLTTPRT